MEFLFAFVIGFAASGVVAYYFYSRQRVDTTVSEQRIAFLIEQVLKENRGASEVLHTTMAVVSDQQNDVKQQLNHLRMSLAKALQALADDLRHPVRLSIGRPSKSLCVSVNDLRELHRKLMPENTKDAGELRTFQVEIAGTSYSPPDAALIHDQLDEWLSEWNKNAEKLPTEPRKQQIHHLAMFHHELLKIHPFVDGNGALSRTILSMQLSVLLGSSRPVVFDDRERYFEALMSADEGDLSLLEELISGLTEDKES